MINKILRVTAGLIVAFFVFGIIAQVLRFFGPAIGGWIVMLLNLSPNPELAKDVEATGNIIVFIIALYPAVKVYKKIVNKQKDDKQIEVTVKD